jgi:hypothetical protein
MIDRALGVSNLEIGLQTLLGTPPCQAGANPGLNIVCNTLAYYFAPMGLLLYDGAASHCESEKDRGRQKARDGDGGECRAKHRFASHCAADQRDHGRCGGRAEQG